MNATLEAMAKALFQGWFVNFNPVRSKLRGNPLVDLDPETDALFPADFEDSAIGPIPKGWRVDRFDAHITADRGLSYKGEGLRDDGTGLPMHNLNSVYEGGGYKHEGIKYYAGEFRERHLVNPGDMIVTNTEQGFDHLLIGHAAIVPACYGPHGLYSHHIYRIRPKPSSPFSPHYLVELFNNPRWHYWISGFSNGTTINMLPMDAMEMPLLVVPPVPLIKKFTAFAAFANSHGGTLLIGVGDGGQILGLEQDYLALGGVDSDKFELHLRNLLNHQLGVAFVTTRVSIRFHQIDDKEICEVETSPATNPLIVAVTDKNGQQAQKFYVRSGNSSQELQMDEVSAYIKDRFHS